MYKPKSEKEVRIKLHYYISLHLNLTFKYKILIIVLPTCWFICQLYSGKKNVFCQTLTLQDCMVMNI